MWGLHTFFLRHRDFWGLCFFPFRALVSHDDIGTENIEKKFTKNQNKKILSAKYFSVCLCVCVSAKQNNIKLNFNRHGE